MTAVKRIYRSGRTLAKSHRRGTVIVLALAVLAILAIAAVAYVSVVRIDRESSAAVAKQANYEQQVGAVIGQIGSLIAADDFGNKIVTNATPRAIPGNPRVWPRAFEDAEFWDYPTTDKEWRELADSADPLELVASASAPIQDRVAKPDDAWLAALEPRWDHGTLEQTSYWPQITNLRSGYAWDQQSKEWKRDHGRYVDLLQWFLNPRSGRGNPAINLNDEGSGGNALGPKFGFDDGGSNRNTGVFEKQVCELDVTAPDESRGFLAPSDERMWADTDGDLRPDARWQQLDSLGNLYGLIWVVAARVVDASALVNVNTALEFPYETRAGVTNERTGTGETPSDVDLFRLLSYAEPNLSQTDARSGVYDADIVISQLGRTAGSNAFREHLMQGLGVDGVIGDLGDPASPLFDARFQSVPNAWTDWVPGTPLTRLQRAKLFDFVTSTIDRPVSNKGLSYPRRDLLDFMSFAGTNNEFILSKFEQRIDGPENNQGFLPDPDTGASVNRSGPMRAAERAVDARQWGTQANGVDTRPTAQRLKFDIRRLLTLVSGVGQLSPIPVLNDAQVNRQDQFDSQYSQRKMLLPDLARGGLSNAEMQKLFGAFVWALAPLATNQPLAPGVPGATAGAAAQAGQEFHYGGGVNGPAVAIQTTSGVQMDTSYAIGRAAAMTVNLMDAMDSEASVGTPHSNEKPTMMRLLKTFDVQTDLNAMTPTDQHGAEVGTRFSHGDVADALLPDEFVGNKLAGTTFIGVDRQPFLRQAHSLAVYQYNNLFGSIDPVTIVPESAPDQLGSILAVEIGNPWPDSIDLSEYRVRFSNGIDEIELDLGQLDPADPNDGQVQSILGGDRAVFYWQDHNPAFESGTINPWDKILLDPTNGWLTKVRSNGANGTVTLRVRTDALSVNGVQYVAGTHTFIPFQALSNPVGIPVMLVRKITPTPPAVGPTEVLVDRMTPPMGATDPFPQVLRPGGFTVLIGDLIAGVPGATAGTARIAVASDLRRPTENPNGFPGYVVERRAANQVAAATIADGTTVQPFVQRWLVPDESGDADYLADIMLSEPTFADYFHLGLEIAAMTPALPAFQIFVPDRPLEYLSELLLVSPFCHTYIHRDISGAALPGFPVLTAAWNMDPSQKQPWSTFSEQLGSDAQLFWNGTSGPVNPYLGLLDPSRFVLSGNVMIAGTSLPDALTIPLALRVLQPFDALAPRTDAELVQGRININTAPAEVLACLPLVAPQFNVPMAGSGAGGLDATLGVDAANNDMPQNRVSTMLAYRDRFDPTSSPGSPIAFNPADSTVTNITGLRGTPGNGNEYTDSRVTRGFIDTGELAILQPWATDGQLNTSYTGVNANPYFLQLGSDSLDTSTAGMPNQLDTYNPPYTGSVPTGWIINPNNDPEERLSIFRAVSNIATTRSDVYIAWFVLRGYDPEVIEGITVRGTNPTLAQARDAMNGTSGDVGAAPLRPTYESRWLVVFDRSNVKQPTDQPKILLKVELPAASP